MKKTQSLGPRHAHIVGSAFVLMLASIAPTWAQSDASFASIDEANKVLQDLAVKREAVQAQFVQDEMACQPKFFMASCLESAKEKRRLALAELRPLEINAERYKRAKKVEQRDQDLAQKQREHELEMPKRLAEQQKREEERQAHDAKVQTEVDAAKAAAAAAQRAQE
ncbi:MAG: hypothetical protein HYZ45_06095, partial [Burkholderiales bacterium]|nr:hypothetical protein [Burkholderiales bacterium]